MTMTPSIYNIVPQDGHWTMVVDQREFGRFATENEAVRIAIETAYQAGHVNFHGAQVILHGDNAMSRIVWTYGRDPFPPSRFE